MEQNIPWTVNSSSGTQKGPYFHEVQKLITLFTETLQQLHTTPSTHLYDSFSYSPPLYV